VPAFYRTTKAGEWGFSEGREFKNRLCFGNIAKKIARSGEGNVDLTVRENERE